MARAFVDANVQLTAATAASDEDLPVTTQRPGLYGAATSIRADEVRRNAERRRIHDVATEVTTASAASRQHPGLRRARLALRRWFARPAVA